ncbi:aspartate ammonia-lyase [Tumebacillus algifaecis]|uniref:aspartate ammonia-lyase n=1 Tax=Tumebacillus algifaecis TaxID=1214604 RepID=A0A223D076_9BACL|nr:class II fumarate hydratase [Tumebacillus algifaecis]ASS74784.1 aspartate ammonia-lyase [Tumebacillus algifaecis]
MNEQFRVSRDSLGEVKVPVDAYYGPQTERAKHNFPISGLRLPRRFIRAQGIIKLCAARANHAVGALDGEVAGAIISAAQEVINGDFDHQFVVDVYQAGAGTSQNMNANEVIASRASELLGGERGDTSRVHPNDHVNMAQSTNDTIHVALNIAAFEGIYHDLLPVLKRFEDTLRTKAAEFDPIVKSGRTHLQDAVPIRLGQEFGGYAQAVENRRLLLEKTARSLLEIGLGGNAVGTGINAHPEYSETAIRMIGEYTGVGFVPPQNFFTFVQNPEAAVGVSGALRALAITINKISNDLRLLASGPRTGFAELKLPAVQPGSSIMPGKVNPVMAEMMNMICHQVIGFDACIASAGGQSQLELNVMMPVLAYNLLQAIHILANGISAFNEKCVRGLEADAERCQHFAEMSTALATSLNPLVGYDRAAEIAKTAYRTGRTVREVAKEQGIDEAALQELLDIRSLTGNH